MNIKSLQINLFAIFVFLSLQPFIVWGRSWLFSIVSISYWILCLFIKPRNFINRTTFLTLIFLSFLFLYITTPFRELDSFTIRHTLYLLMIWTGVIWLSQDIIVIWKKFKLILVFVSILSIISTLLFYLNFPFPDIQINSDFRLKNTDIYRVYYGMIYLNTQVYDMYGTKVLRNVGWFGEPGHYGIYLCIVLALEKKPFEGKSNLILVTAIISTLSAAAYLILLGIYLLRAKTKSTVKSIAFIIALFPILYFSGIYKILDIITSKFTESEDIIESRSNLNLSIINFNSENFLLGYGSDALLYFDVYSSDIRAFLVKYGLISIIFIILSILPSIIYLLKRRNYRDFAIVIFIICAIASHRIWMIDTIIIWIFLFAICISNSKYNMRAKNV